jgi:ABC-type transport system involved in multi-copper enzyme maturation permease subunit
MTKIWALAQHEFRAAVRSRTLFALFAVFILVTSASILIAAFAFKTKVIDYNVYKAAAQAAGATYIAAPQQFPLQLLRGAIEYVEIIGSIIAIALGYVSVAQARSNRTMQLVLSRPVRTYQLVMGRLLGATSIFAALVTVTGAVAYLSIGLISRMWLTSDEVVKLVVAYSTSIVYMLIFYCVGIVFTLRSRVPVNGLILGFATWLLIVMILPQIGDTMDVDNQVPGGLFHALQVAKPQERQILAHFKSYESIRTGLETASIEKHYERFNFAVTGIKDQYNQLPLGKIISAKRGDLGWLGGGLVGILGALTLSMRRKFMIR